MGKYFWKNSSVSTNNFWLDKNSFMKCEVYKILEKCKSTYLPYLHVSKSYKYVYILNICL